MAVCKSLPEVVADLDRKVADRYPDMDVEDRDLFAAAALSKIASVWEFHPGCDIVIFGVDEAGTVVDRRPLVMQFGEVS
jgi:hypothetical protein